MTTEPWCPKLYLPIRDVGKKITVIRPTETFDDSVSFTEEEGGPRAAWRCILTRALHLPHIRPGTPCYTTAVRIARWDGWGVSVIPEALEKPDDEDD